MDVSASEDMTVRVWHAAMGECELTMKEHTEWVNSARFSPDGLKVVSASRDQTVRVWSAATGKCEHTMEGHSAFSPEGRQIARSADVQLRCWDGRDRG